MPSQGLFDKYRLNYRLSIEPGGQVAVRVGRPSPRFVSAVRDIVHLHGIERGTIECKGRGSSARLRFGDGFPERGRQAVRNAWSPPTTPGGGGSQRASS